MGSNKDSGLSFPDFVKIAEGHGVSAIRLDSHDNLKENIHKFLEEDGMGLCELMLDHEQDQCPKAINRRKPDGTTERLCLKTCILSSIKKKLKQICFLL